MEPDDATHVAQARAGDLDAFGALVRRYERRVRSVLARLLDDERDVDEAAVLELALAATKSRIHRVRMRIRAALEAWEQGAD